MEPSGHRGAVEMDVRIPAGRATIAASWWAPARVAGGVIFAHGAGSSRYSPRNRYIAGVLRDGRFATLLLDLLTLEEEEADRHSGLGVDVVLLAHRLVTALEWLSQTADAAGLPLGLFGASTGAAAALMAAAQRPEMVRAVVSRGGRPDLANNVLGAVQAPTLFIVGARDDGILEIHDETVRDLTCQKAIEVVPGATHFFEEPGTLERVAELARGWFERHLTPDVERAA